MVLWDAKPILAPPNTLKTPFGYWLHFVDSTVKCLKGCSPVELGISLRPVMILMVCGLHIGCLFKGRWLVPFLLTYLLQMGIEFCLFLLGECIRFVVCPSVLYPFDEFLLEEVELVATFVIWYASLRGEGVHRGAFLANEQTGFFHRHHLVIIRSRG